jgi:S-disulfanyl-L-cysteine oxidoreductase SoxD
MRTTLVVVLVAAGACQMSEAAQNQNTPARYGVGRTARPAEIRPWDIDVNPNGAGLPAGRGNYARGASVYAQQCASCHGAKGEGGTPPNARLVGTEPRDFTFAQNFKLSKTIGNYWPYATTLFDYVNRAMPFNAPSTLAPDDVYSVVAYLLAENGIVPRTAIMDARSLPRVRMPARDRFVPDDRKGGAVFK